MNKDVYKYIIILPSFILIFLMSEVTSTQSRQFTLRPIAVDERKEPVLETEFPNLQKEENILDAKAVKKALN